MSLHKKCALFALLSAFSLFSALPAFAARFHVGILQLVEHPSLDEIRTAITSELEENGYGPDVVGIDYENGQNSPQLINTICRKFVAHGVDVIVPIATPAAQGAAAATDEIPIVFAAVSAPVEAGLVESMEHPGGNVTGVSDAIHPSGVLDLADKLTPGIRSYGIIYNTAEASSSNTARKAKAEMTRRGLKFREAVVSTSAEVPAACGSLIGNVDAIYVPDDNTTALAMPLLSQMAIENEVPVYTAVDSLVHDGGLATSGLNYTDLGRQTARMVIRVLEGESPADMAVEVPEKLSVVINPGTAEELGIDVEEALAK